LWQGSSKVETLSLQDLESVDEHLRNGTFREGEPLLRLNLEYGFEVHRDRFQVEMGDVRVRVQPTSAFPDLRVSPQSGAVPRVPSTWLLVYWCAYLQQPVQDIDPAYYTEGSEALFMGVLLGPNPPPLSAGQARKFERRGALRAETLEDVAESLRSVQRDFEMVLDARGAQCAVQSQ
jgi:hypothetical protein